MTWKWSFRKSKVKIRLSKPWWNSSKTKSVRLNRKMSHWKLSTLIYMKHINGWRINSPTRTIAWHKSISFTISANNISHFWMISERMLWSMVSLRCSQIWCRNSQFKLSIINLRWPHLEVNRLPGYKEKGQLSNYYSSICSLHRQRISQVTNQKVQARNRIVSHWTPSQPWETRTNFSCTTLWKETSKTKVQRWDRRKNPRIYPLE